MDERDEEECVEEKKGKEMSGMDKGIEERGEKEWHRK